jgi:parallel beta-helix repeat protein
VNKLLPFGCTGIIVLGCLAPALAKPVETRTAQIAPLESTSARDLAIEPHIGGGVSTSGAGIPRFSHIEGFAPLLQTPGEDILFLEGRLSWLDYERVGTNLTLGYRSHDGEGDRIFGGYISYDSQDTGNSRFNQLGFGFERLGEDWDLRLNSYIPIGENRKQVGSTVSATSNASISSFAFQRNLLLFAGTQTRTDTRQYEAAMLAIDGEAGGKLAEINNFGEVRGYGGLYYLDAANSTALGWRARLEARALDNYTVGLGVQHDAVFGTNFIFNFGVNFGGVSAEKKEDELLARMGEFVTRNNAIIIDEQTEITTSSETFDDLVALNPVTGEQWFFQHVSNTEGSGGDGTFENPFSTISQGISEANTNSTNNQNEIVYVQFGNNITNTTAITIPENIQLLSVAPTQTIDTQQGTIQLPLSGAGTSQRPQINATVTMGNNSVLSGFDINNVAGDGTISGDGINASNVTGFTITENSVSNVPRFGIFVGVNDGSTANNISITNNTVSNVTNYDGIFVGARNASTIETVTISGNTFSNIARTGIALGAHGNSTLSNVTISGNTIDTTGTTNTTAFGIGIGVDTAVEPILTGITGTGSVVSNVVITNNRISNSSANVATPNAGGSVGVATQSTSSRVCFQLSGNNSINPPAVIGPPYSNNLDLYLVNIADTVTGDAANFQIVDRDNLNSINNNTFDILNMFVNVAAFPSTTLDNTNSTNVSSCS